MDGFGPAINYLLVGTSGHDLSIPSTLSVDDELDDLMIAYLKACRETPDKAPGLEKKMKAKTAQLAALQDQGIDAHPSWADVE